MGAIDRFFYDKKEELGKYALQTLILPYLKEFGSIALQEFAAAMNEFVKEWQTPDGWTEDEYLAYAITRLRLIREKDLLLPYFVETYFDDAVAALEQRLQRKLDDDIVDPDEPDDDEEDPVEPPYDVLTDTVPDPLLFPDGTTLWRKQTTDPTGQVKAQFRALKGMVGYPGEKQIGRKENGAWIIF